MHKKGDKVIRIVHGPHYKQFQPGIVIAKDEKYIDDYLVLTRTGFGYTKVYWNKSAFISYNVYKSPLYKALGEN